MNAQFTMENCWSWFETEIVRHRTGNVNHLNKTLSGVNTQES